MRILSPGCLIGSTLSLTALLANPDGAAQRFTDSARAELTELETLGRVAVSLDSGPAPLRWVIGLRPARDVAAEILGDGAAGISWELAALGPLLPALRTAKRPASPQATGLTDAVAVWVVNAIRGPDRAAPPEATQALSHVDRMGNAVARARLRIVLLVLSLGGLRWLECLGLVLAVRAWLRHRAPSLQPPAARPLDSPPRAVAIRWLWPPRGESDDPVEQALTSSGVPPALAAEIAARFAEAPDWPGSLRGHDREPGGLRGHTLLVLTHTEKATASWSPEERTAAAVVAAAHDLGKLVAYRRVGPDRWVGAASTPHDSLSTILLMQCRGWTTFASSEIRGAILQALYSQHAQEGLPSNAPALARELLTMLAAADAAAAQEGSFTPRGEASAEEGPADVA